MSSCTTHAPFCPGVSREKRRTLTKALDAFCRTNSIQSYGKEGGRNTTSYNNKPTNALYHQSHCNLLRTHPYTPDKYARVPSGTLCTGTRTKSDLTRLFIPQPPRATSVPRTRIHAFHRLGLLPSVRSSSHQPHPLPPEYLCH